MNFSFKHGNDYLQKKQAVKWLIKGWVPKSGLMMIYGEPGSGKSFIALDMMLSISTSKPAWHGCRIAPIEGCIIYLCGEGDEGNSQRISAWIKEKNNGVKETGPIFIGSSPLNLDEERVVENLVEKILKEAKMTPCLIVIDTLNMYFSGEENNARDARNFIRGCQRMSQKFEALVMIIHHTGKSREMRNEARGSSAFHASMDSEILVTRYEGNVSLESRKQKNGKIPEMISMKFKSVTLDDWEPDEDGEVPTSLVPVTLEKDCYETIQNELVELGKAWKHSGRKINDVLGCPYLSKDEMKEYFRSIGKSKDEIYNAFREGHSRFLYKLIKAEIIEEKEKDVYFVINPAIIDELLSETEEDPP